MPEPALTAHDLIAWLESTSSNWREVLTAHPELLSLPCDIMNTGTIAQLLQHIVAVELRFTERLADLPASDYTAVPYDSVDVLYATHDRTMALLRDLLAKDLDWDASIEYTTRVMGPARSRRKTLLFHLILHSIRHYAQLATLVRQHGVKPGSPMDYLLMDIHPA